MTVLGPPVINSIHQQILPQHTCVPDSSLSSVVSESDCCFEGLADAGLFPLAWSLFFLGEAEATETRLWNLTTAPTASMLFSKGEEGKKDRKRLSMQIEGLGTRVA